MSKDKDIIDDSSFKDIIRNANILSAIIGRYVDDFQGMSAKEIRKCLDVGKNATYVKEMNTERATPRDPLHMDAVFDVKSPHGKNDNVRIIVNVEGQNNVSNRYPMENRIQYYVSELIYMQKGTYFENDDYGSISKVYSIWFMMDPLKRYRNTVIRYSLGGRYVGNSPDAPIPDMDLINAIVVNLGEYNGDMDAVLSFPALLFAKGMDFVPWKREMKTKFNVDVSQLLYRKVRKMVSIVADSRERYFDEGANAVVSRIADSVLKTSEIDRVPISTVLDRSHYDDDLRREVKAEIERRGAIRGDFRW
ncbi:MAG: hypothetical protein IK043_01505 [Candidatus Methanomethylophilaceae archaeon]|nr:hypothetical protein [Candidatus Methanomethylophilaceae archaeon]